MNNKGVVLVTVMIVVFLLFVLVGAFLFLSINARLLNERYHENLVVLELAEAGVDYAIWEANYGGDDFSAAEGWSGLNPKTITINNFQDADGNTYGDINILVYDPGTNNVTIISEGSLDSITGPTVSRKVRVVLKDHKLFSSAILTQVSMDIGGNGSIDSYDSSLGPYGGTNVGQNGDVATNGQGDPAITIQGNPTVEGDAITGPTGTVSVGGSATLSGEIDDTAEVFIPPVIVPDTLVSLTSLGNISLGSHESLELFSGNYKYDFLDLSAQGTLILNGNVNLYFTQNPSINTTAQSQIITRNGTVNIYFEGDLSMAGQGVLNATGIPSNLTFYGTENVSNISLAGGGEFHGMFYSPSADISLSGNSEIFGAIVSKNATLLGSATIHYDEALKDPNGPTIGYDPYAWQEKY